MNSSSTKSASSLSGSATVSQNGGTAPGFVVGVDLGGSNLRIALADAHGTMVGRWRASTKETSSPQEVIGQIAQGVHDLLRQSSLSRDALSSIAAGAPGVTDSEAGIVVATSYLKGWTKVPFQHLLESAFRVPAAVENDVRLAAIGEHWTGAAQDIDDFVFLAIGTGIGAGIFSNGRLIRGPNFTAGEVGYMYVPGAPLEPPEHRAPGSLERAIGGEAIRQRWSDACKSDPQLSALCATDIFARAAAEDPLAKDVLEHSARLLAFAVYNISAVLNTSLFVLGGSIGASPHLLAATERVLDRYEVPVRPKLVPSSLGTDAQLMGAVRLALTTTEVRSKS
jgi:glucokinase